VARRLSLRRAPELRFFHDKTVEAVARIDALLKADS
jgi:ribosome-binding factor A